MRSLQKCEYSATYKSKLKKHIKKKHTGAVECGVKAKKIKLTAEKIQTEPECVKYELEFVYVKNKPEFFHVKYDPEPKLVEYKPKRESDDYDNGIKSEILDEDPLA